jgi:hypothetical protein
MKAKLKKKRERGKIRNEEEAVLDLLIGEEQTIDTLVGLRRIADEIALPGAATVGTVTDEMIALLNIAILITVAVEAGIEREEEIQIGIWMTIGRAAEMIAIAGTMVVKVPHTPEPKLTVSIKHQRCRNRTRTPPCKLR